MRLVTGLAPVALNPDITATPMVPMTVNPAGVGVGWFHIGSRDPDVAIAVPAVITCVPCPVGVLMWRGRNDFMRSRRGADTDYDLGVGNACREKKEGAGNCREEFLHRAISLSY
jgi:hypothetical protein